MLTFDHLKLVKRDPVELARFREFLLGGQIGIWDEVKISHERNESCCRREPWNETLVTIYEAVKPPTKLVAVNLPMEEGP